MARYECAFVLVLDDDNIETPLQAAAVFDGWVKDPHAKWAYRITKLDEAGNALDCALIDIGEHDMEAAYPD